MHRTDVYSPWTLCFFNPDDEAAYAKHLATSLAKFTALGSLAEVLLPLTMVFKTMLSPAATSTPAAAYALRMVVLMVIARGLPCIAWLAAPTPAIHQRIKTPVLLLSRSLNVLYVFHYVLFLQAFCLQTGCQLLRGLLLDIILITMVIEPLIKQTRFFLHLPMSLLELSASIFTLASAHGVCGAQQILNSPSNAAACDNQCLSTIKTGLVTCATQFSSTPCVHHEQLPEQLRKGVDWVLSAMGIPDDAWFVGTCPELRVLGQQRCAVLSQSMRAGARAVAHVISWLTVSGVDDGDALHTTALLGGGGVDGRGGGNGGGGNGGGGNGGGGNGGGWKGVFSSSSAAAAKTAAVQQTADTMPSMCAELVLVTLVAHVCIACVLYHAEAARRWQWWQAQHVQQVLHPPLKTLRVFLVIQHVFWVMGVMCMAWVGWSRLL